MKVEIWSDIVCPFCYIGKRKFEAALNSFDNKDKVEVVWRSFQLDPAAKSESGKTVAQSLAEKKGLSVERVQQMQVQVTKMAEEVGLPYNLDKSVIANTYNAHRLLHLAAKHNLQDAAEERLFAANLIDGKDVGDLNTLVQLGVEIGLEETEVKAVLESNSYAAAVQQDMLEAQQIGVTGVPYFVINNKYAVSGAQPSSVFSQVLAKVWEEEQPVKTIVAEGGVCSADGICS